MMHFETLADPTRRRILATLRAGEQPVGAIVRDAGIHQSGVSRHLKILQELYALKPEPFRELEAWLSDYRQLWEARFDRFGAALETRRRKESDT